MRIFTAAYGVEINTFSPIPTTMKSFRDLIYIPSREVEKEDSSYSLLCASARKYAPDNCEIIQGLRAGAQPGGLLSRSVYESLRDELLSDLNSAGDVDVVLLQLHGAMVSDDYDDCEGDILQRVRAIVGANAIIGVLLDPHCHLTDEMVSAADIIVLFKEYPHTDIPECADRVVELCLDAVSGETTPLMAVFDCRLIDIFHTTSEPMKSFVARMKKLEEGPDILSVSLVHGFPWGDVPGMGTKVLIVSDGEHEQIDQIGDELRCEIVRLRGKTSARLLSYEEMNAEIGSLNSGPIIVADSSDNPGGGSPGDATYLLSSLLENGVKNIAIGAIWDPVAAELAIGKGIGSQISVRVGGKTCPLSGAPLDIEAKITGIKFGATQMFGGAPWPSGDLVRLTAGGLDIIISTHRVQCFGREVFEDVGIDLSRKFVVVVKSSQHFHASFAPIAQKILYVGGHGVNGNILDLNFEKIRRPLWPWDEDHLNELLS